jgi:hypothetical protein
LVAVALISYSHVIGLSVFKLQTVRASFPFSSTCIRLININRAASFQLPTTVKHQ